MTRTQTTPTLANASSDVLALSPGTARARLVAFMSGMVRSPASLKSALSTLDQAIVSGTSFATSVIIGRFCEPAQLGIYYLALTVVLFLTGIPSELVSSPYSIFRQRRRGRAIAAYSGSSLIHQLTLTPIAMAGILAFVACIYAQQGWTDLVAALLIVAGLGPFLMLRHFMRQFTFANLQVKSAILLDTGIAVMQISALLWLATTGRLDVVGVYLVMGGVCAVAALAWFAAWRRSFRFVRKRIWIDWLYNWAFAKWALVTHIISTSTPYFIPWILTYAYGESQTAIYAASVTLVGLSQVFVNGVLNMMTPNTAAAYARGGVAALRGVLQQVAVVYATCIGAFCIIVAFGGDLMMRFTYGEQYVDAGHVSTFLALAVFANAMGVVVGSGLWAVHRPRLNIVADVTTLVMTLVAAFTLVAPFEVLGAAVAAFVGTASGTIVRAWTMTRLFRSLESERRGSVTDAG